MERLVRRILKRINNFLFEDFADTGADSSRRLMLTYVFSIIGVVIFGIYAIYNVFMQSFALLVLNSIAALCFLSIILWLPKARNYKVCSYLMHIFLSIYFIMLIILLKSEVTTFLIWFSLFPFISILTLGRRNGFNVSLAMLGAIILLYIVQTFLKLERIPFGALASVAFSFLVTLLLVYYSDMVRHNITKRLVKSNLELKSAQNKLVKLNKLDQLSGVYNRNYLESFYTNNLSNNSKKKKCLSMLMMDIDNFKSYNDTYGHINGDKVIANVANVIKDSCRDDDIIIRYGGEEFLAILFGRDIKEGEYIARLIIEGVHNLEIEHKQSSTGYVTVSIGLTGCCSDEEIDKREMIKIADGALYEAKNKGKNCCAIKPFEVAAKTV